MSEMLSSAWESSGQKLKSGLCVEQYDCVNKKNEKMVSLSENENIGMEIENEKK